MIYFTALFSFENSNKLPGEKKKSELLILDDFLDLKIRDFGVFF